MSRSSSTGFVELFDFGSLAGSKTTPKYRPARPLLQDDHPHRRSAPSRACGIEGGRPADNAAPFKDRAEECLIPNLPPGDIVVMDNLPTHKETRVEHLISSAGAELQYPPPYSPNHLDGRSRLKFRERAFAEVGMTTAGAFAGHSAGNANTVSAPPSEV